MKKENSTLEKKLKQYSAFAGSLLAISGTAQAQAVYTDLNPDVSLVAVDDSYQLDMNNDGSVDFVFKIISYSAQNWQRACIAPYPYSTGNTNALLGTYQVGNPIIFGYPSALSQGNAIDGGQPQFILNDVVFTSNSAAYFLFPALLEIYSGAPYGFWQDGVTDHYVGVKFFDGTDTFFGWARCDVGADALSITIKDYAYNANAGEGLFAGQGDPAGIGTVNQSTSFSVFGYEGVANIFVNDGKFDGASVTVTNTLGQTMVTQGLNNRTTHIDLNQFGKGIYLVTVQRGEEVFSKKVSFR